MMINSYKILLICLCSFVFISRANAQDRTKRKLDIKKAWEKLSKDSCFVHSSIGFVIIDQKTGETLLSENPQKAIYPASNTKLFSSSLALNVLGKDHVQYSKVYYEGNIDKDSTLHGNLIIDGNFNPCLGSNFISSKEAQDEFLKQWSKAVVRKGIRRIKGTVLAKESSMWKNRYGSWMLEDVLYPYGCAVSQTGSFDNGFTLKAMLPNDGSDTSGIISIYPKIKNALFFNRITKDSLKKTEIDVNEETELGKNAKFVLIGNIKKVKDTATLELAQPNPALTLSYLLCDYLKQIHVEVETNVGLVYELPKTLNAIDSTPSPTVAQLVRFTNHQSNNLFAECLLRMAAKQSGFENKDLGKFVIDYWTGKCIKMNGSTVIDGSGLSRMDAISPLQIVELLKWMGESENKDIFKNSLPIAGVSGTLKHFCKGTAGENRIFAKTGSATGIQCYSGYIETKAGRKLIFSLLINQFSGQRSSMRHKLEGFFNQIIKN